MSSMPIRRATLALLLALGLVLTACDTGEAPPGAGTWALDDGAEQTDIDYWHITPEAVTVIVDLTDQADTDLQCARGEWEITAIDDDVLSLLIGDELAVDYQIEPDNGALYATELGDDENYIQEQVSFEAVDELPFDLEDCAEIQW